MCPLVTSASPSPGSITGGIPPPWPSTRPPSPRSRHCARARPAGAATAPRPLGVIRDAAGRRRLRLDRLPPPTSTPASFYLVVFRSVRRAGADGDLLTEFDDRAHAEARRAGGLLLYFKGEPDANRACLSLCLWETREQARAAIHQPRHRAAVGLASTMYESFHLERYVVTWAGAGSVVIAPA